MKIKIHLISVFFFSFALLHSCTTMPAPKVAADLPSSAAEELITTVHEPNGEPVPYFLNYNNLPPKFIIILFPGGSGRVDPFIRDGKLFYGFRGNFLIRSRKYMVEDEFATITTNSTSREDRIQAILDDINRRFAAARIYLMGTSNGTDSTMRLAGYLSDRIAGEIHTSSLSAISFFDARKYKNRHLIVHHKYDPCHRTPFRSAEHSHKKYGNEFIAMDGGISSGPPCEAFSYHGYNGIEKETITAIKAWIRQGG